MDLTQLNGITIRIAFEQWGRSYHNEASFVGLKIENGKGRIEYINMFPDDSYILPYSEDEESLEEFKNFNLNRVRWVFQTPYDGWFYFEDDNDDIKIDFCYCEHEFSVENIYDDKYKDVLIDIIEKDDPWSLSSREQPKPGLLQKLWETYNDAWMDIVDKQNKLKRP